MAIIEYNFDNASSFRKVSFRITDKGRLLTMDTSDEKDPNDPTFNFFNIHLGESRPCVKAHFHITNDGTGIVNLTVTRLSLNRDLPDIAEVSITDLQGKSELKIYLGLQDATGVEDLILTKPEEVFKIRLNFVV